MTRKKRTPPQAVKKAFVAGLRAAVRQGQPGAWASDHKAETQHITSWTYVAIRTIALQAMQAAVDVYLDEGQQEARKARRKALRKSWGTLSRYKAYGGSDDASEPLPPEHPLCRLLKRPNPWQSGASFRYQQVFQLQGTGTCLIWKIENNRGLTVERYVIPTGIAEPVQPARDYPNGGYRISPEWARYWATEQDGFQQGRPFLSVLGRVIPVEDMQVIRWQHPLYMDDGYSPLAAGALTIDTANMVDRARWSHLKNGPDPSIAVSLGKDVDMPDEETADRYAAKFNQKYSGVENTGKAVLLPDGTTVSPLTTSPHEMEYIGAYTQLRDAILALHGVSPIAAGVTDGGSYAAFYAALRQTTELTVQPVLSLLAEEDTEQLAPQFGDGLTIEMEAANIDDPDLLERQLATNISAGNVMKVNEYRSLRGLPLLDGPEGEAFVGRQAPTLAFGQPEPKPATEGTTGQAGVPTLDLLRVNGKHRMNGKH